MTTTQIVWMFVVGFASVFVGGVIAHFCPWLRPISRLFGDATLRDLGHDVVLTKRVPVTVNMKIGPVSCAILPAGIKPPFICLTGINSDHWTWNSGDHVVLWSGSYSTRYRIERCVRSDGQGSRYFIECRLAPRPQ